MAAALRSRLCIIFLWFVADFEKRLEEEGAVTKSLGGAGRTEAGPPVDQRDRGGPDTHIYCSSTTVYKYFVR